MNAQEILDCLIRAELIDAASDPQMQTVISRERQALQVALKQRTEKPYKWPRRDLNDPGAGWTEERKAAEIAARMKEAVRVARMWGVEL